MTGIDEIQQSREGKVSYKMYTLPFYAKLSCSPNENRWISLFFNNTDPEDYLIEM